MDRRCLTPLAQFDEALAEIDLLGEEFMERAELALRKVNSGKVSAEPVYGRGVGIPDRDTGLVIDPVLALCPKDCVIRIEVINPYVGEIDWSNIQLEAVLESGIILKQEKCWDDCSFMSAIGEEYFMTCIPFKSSTQALRVIRGECHTIRRISH